MATYESYRTKTGERRHMATIRLRGFRRTYKTFATLADAKDWASTTEKAMREERQRGGTRADVGTLTVRQLVDAFLEDPGTKKRRYHPELSFLLSVWVDEYGSMKAKELGRLQLVTFRNARVADGLSAARANRYLSAMRRAWHWGQENGFVLQSASWPQKIMLEEEQPPALMPTIEEVSEMFAACDTVSANLGTLVRMLVGTGARLSDVLAITWRDVDQKDWDVVIRGQKTDSPARIAMLAPAKEAIRRADKVRHVGGRVFWFYKDRDAMRWEWKKAKVNFPESLKKMRLHDCRHVCASLLAAQGATDIELAAQLTHSTLAMVKRYSHLRGGHRGEAHGKLDEAFAKQ
ncbi:MAG TPA: site-specific integrase [Steroidobacteraceae bacterium]|nr:site-specific integrase [Steroidobacteraceae bacterium]